MTYQEDEYLMLSGIQHFIYCKRQWALIHIEQIWEDNYLTKEGEILHDIAHDVYKNDKRRNLIVSRAMPIYSSALGLRGECDIVEFVADENGCFIEKLKGKYNVAIVEYKHGEPKEDDSDILQLSAQVMCLEEMLNCNINSASVFYNKTKKRLKIEIDDELREKVQMISFEMHKMFDEGILPKASKTKKCSRCSLGDVCLSKATDCDKLAKYLEGLNDI